MVLTDYPDKALLDNLTYNVDQNVLPPRRDAVRVLGYVWGSSVDTLLAATATTTTTTTTATLQQDTEIELDTGTRSNFDLILLSDLIFNHSQVRPSSLSNIIIFSTFFPSFLGIE